MGVYRIIFCASVIGALAGCTTPDVSPDNLAERLDYSAHYKSARPDADELAAHERLEAIARAGRDNLASTPMRQPSQDLNGFDGQRITDGMTERQRVAWQQFLDAFEQPEATPVRRSVNDLNGEVPRRNPAYPPRDSHSHRARDPEEGIDRLANADNFSDAARAIERMRLQRSPMNRDISSAELDGDRSYSFPHAPPPRNTTQSRTTPRVPQDLAPSNAVAWRDGVTEAGPVGNRVVGARRNAAPRREDMPQADQRTDVDDSVGAMTHLYRAIRQMERDLADANLDPSELARLETQIRMMQLAAGDAESAFQEFQHVQGNQAEFLRQTLYALHVMFREERNPVLAHRSTLAMDHINQALSQLRSISKLDLRNAALCSSVLGYADVEEFPSDVFQPGQVVVAYVEPENFDVEEVTTKRSGGRRVTGAHGGPVGYETEFQADYQIRHEGRIIEDRKLVTDRQVCRNRRRDYYIPYEIRFPTDLEPGQYSLELHVHDVKGDKHGQAFFSFRIAR